MSLASLWYKIRHVRMRMSIGYLEPLVIIIFIFFIFGVTFVHANLCLYILASTCQDGSNPFPVIRLPVVNCVTDSSRHTLLQPALHSQWSRQVYIGHRSIFGFLVVQEPTCTHAHEYRLFGASCSLLEFFLSVTKPRSLQIISHGHVRLSSSPVIRSWCSLAHLLSVLTPRRNISFKDRMKNHFRPAFGLQRCPH